MVPPPPPPPLPPPPQPSLGQQSMNLMHLYRPTPSLGLSFNSSLLSSYAAGLSHHFSPVAAAAAAAAAAAESYPVMSGCTTTTPAATSTPRRRHASEQDGSDESDIDVTDDRSSVASSSFASELGRRRRKRFRSSGDEEVEGNESDSDRHSQRSETSCSTNPASCQVSDRDASGDDKKKTKESGEQPLDLSKSTKENERDTPQYVTLFIDFVMVETNWKPFSF